MLENLDAQEIADWGAFEHVEGQLGRQWDREILARILEATLAQGGVKDPRVGRPWRTFEEEKTEEEIAAEKAAVVAALDAAYFRGE